jgi:tRNA nucleotidyltransferase (CCA-adding enzyme)
MPSIADHLDRHLAQEQVRLLRRASSIAAEHGAKLYLVGGTVRDVLLGGQPVDLDLTAQGGPPELADALASGLGGEVTSRSRFGTANLSVGGLELDLAVARTESYARPGALPDVSPGTIEQDLARREFSINAMAAGLSEEGWGRLLDPHDGMADLRAGIIRVLHSGSFVDDATRILRAVRYAGRLEFEIEPETRRLLARDLRHLDGISGDRLRNELERLFAEDRWAECLQRAQDDGVLQAVHPALSLEQRALDRLRAESGVAKSVRLAATLYFVAPRQVDAVIARLNLAGRWAAIARDVAGLGGALERLDAPRIRRSHVYDLLNGMAPAAIEGVALVCDRPRAVQRLRLYLDELLHVSPLLDGTDLLALGVPQGPRVGELLHALLEARLEGLVSTRDDEEAYVKRSLAPG